MIGNIVCFVAIVINSIYVGIGIEKHWHKGIIAFNLTVTILCGIAIIK